MAASYSMVLIPQAEQAIVANAVRACLGGARQNIHAETTLSATNRAVAISPPQGPKRIVCVVIWWSEFGIDSATWYYSNPLAQCLSQTMGTTFVLWTINAGLAAGYSAWTHGSRAEQHVVGEPSTISQSTHNNMQSGILANLLDQPGFSFDAHMRTFGGDLERGTAGLAKLIGLTSHLCDIMDIVDGDGVVEVVDDEYRGLNTDDWIVERL